MSPIKFLFLLALASRMALASSLAAAVISVQIDGIGQSDQSNLELTTLRFNPDYPRFERADHAWQNHSPGRWKADLPAGIYELEVVGELNGQTVFCRSAPMRVASRPIQWIDQLQLLQIQFVHRGEPLDLQHVAIRSHDVKGETILQTKDDKTRVELYTTPSTTLDTTLVGEDKDTIALGYALLQIKPLQSRRSGDAEPTKSLATVTATGRHWHERPIVLSPDNPPVKSAQLTLVYPRGELQVDYRDGIEIVTNRDLFHVGYKLESTSGRKLVSRKCFVRVDRVDRFVLGGKLEPSAFAKILTKLPNEKQYRVAGLLNDPSGIEINVHESDIAWSEDFKMRGNESLPKNPLDEIELGLLGDPLLTVRVGVSWQWIPIAKFDSPPNRSRPSEANTSLFPRRRRGATVPRSICTNLNFATRSCSEPPSAQDPSRPISGCVAVKDRLGHAAINIHTDVSSLIVKINQIALAGNTDAVNQEEAGLKESHNSGAE